MATVLVLGGGLGGVAAAKPDTLTAPALEHRCAREAQRPAG